MEQPILFFVIFSVRACVCFSRKTVCNGRVVKENMTISYYLITISANYVINVSPIEILIITVS